MPRDINGSLLAQLQEDSNVLRFAVLVDITFVSETVHAWTGYGNFSWGGNTYLGLGALASVSTVSEDSTVQAQSVTLTLDGISEANLSEALGDIRQGLPANVWLALFGPDGKTLIGAPYLSFAGKVDQPTIKESPENCTISISCENRMAQLQRANERRYTQQQQQQLYPSDQGLNYVNLAAWFVGSWGQSS